MIQQNMGNIYAKVGIESTVSSASPHKLVLLLFEKAIETIEKAKVQISRGNTIEKAKAISKVIAIIGGLQEGLNMEAGGEIAENLKRLYDYICPCLVEANLKNDVVSLNEISRLIQELTEGWKAIEGHATLSLQNLQVSALAGGKLSYGKC
ncbi:MAG: flagellar export chaperone FliS [Nitrospiria bacterium]